MASRQPPPKPFWIIQREPSKQESNTEGVSGCIHAALLGSAKNLMTWLRLLPLSPGPEYQRARTS